VYREAIDEFSIKGGTATEKLPAWEKSLSSVFNRGFWEGGYYLGDKTSAWAKSGDNQATRRKTFLGPVVNFFNKAKIAEIALKSGPLLPGDQVVIIGPTTGAIEFTVTEIRKADERVAMAAKGDTVTFPCPEKVRPNDCVYRFRSIHKKT
jgi:putative protease